MEQQSRQQFSANEQPRNNAIDDALRKDSVCKAEIEKLSMRVIVLYIMLHALKS